MRTLLRLYVIALPGLLMGGGLEAGLRYLEQEVPLWHRENHCHSCHNNGDAARALLMAHRAGNHVEVGALRDTLEWLGQPERWDESPGQPAFSDKRLARIQFGVALVEAGRARLIEGGARLARAAALVASDQNGAGGWMVDPDSSSGSPVTYGPVLATHLARQVLLAAGREKEAARAEAWLRGRPANNVVDAAAKVLALGDAAALQVIEREQAANGSWTSEAFDTALALLALQGHRGRPGVPERIRRGRAYLMETQLSAGGWVGTTRPAGAASYAQHISTCGWAVMALVATEPPLR
ncbi:MAG: hypothetical protein JJE04_17745 [Acidobacteriia bacterium]|nr:hypothetical protein [Terriglobia bacterium]